MLSKYFRPIISFVGSPPVTYILNNQLARGFDVLLDIPKGKSQEIKFGHITHCTLATKISWENFPKTRYPSNLGFFLRPRQKFARQGLQVCGGVIDFGFSGEITAELTSAFVGHSLFVNGNTAVLQLVPAENYGVLYKNLTVHPRLCDVREYGITIPDDQQQHQQ